MSARPMHLLTIMAATVGVACSSASPHVTVRASIPTPEVRITETLRVDRTIVNQSPARIILSFGLPDDSFTIAAANGERACVLEGVRVPLERTHSIAPGDSAVLPLEVSLGSLSKCAPGQYTLVTSVVFTSGSITGPSHTASSAPLALTILP